ncbi:MAG: substrate-binding domain-containing protein [Deltaproteobacteria bacterium]|nr:substrate-binding domain-containing protein [Deltaproteobacteria bacterium]MBW2136564.1 substrate-binding domain-containing protein [Deltaproteobacteria bacterium]
MFIPGKKPRFFTLVTLAAILILTGLAYGGNANVIKMATTTSTENSGLLDVLLPEFTEDTGIGVKVFAKGTGAALRDGMDGNVDIVFVHAKEDEERFVAQGYGAYRFGVMHNDFVILGPGDDPAGIRGSSSAIWALKKIFDRKAMFISRGDDSGTHKKEQALWKAARLPLNRQTKEFVKKGKRQSMIFLYPEGLGKWYMSIGQGMGKALTYAEEKRAYTLSDRGTYLKYRFGRKRGLDLDILCEGDPLLHNPYGIIPINPKVHPHVKFRWADTLAKWVVSAKAQRLIAGFKIQGRQAFFPDALPGAE